MPDLSSQLSNPELDERLKAADIAHTPRILFSTAIFHFYIEISGRIRNAQPLSTESQKENFYNKIEDFLSLKSESFETISWEEILPAKIMDSIRNDKKIFGYIQAALSGSGYPKTAMHGDLNPQNVLIDPDHKFWIVDWENSARNGSALWDLYWFYSIWKRDASKAPDDIISIFTHSTKSPEKTREILLIYALMKLRLDLSRHQKTIETGLDDFFRRISSVMVIC